MVSHSNRHVPFTDFVLSRVVSVLDREYQVRVCTFQTYVYAFVEIHVYKNSVCISLFGGHLFSLTVYHTFLM